MTSNLQSKTGRKRKLVTASELLQARELLRRGDAGLKPGDGSTDPSRGAVRLPRKRGFGLRAVAKILNQQRAVAGTAGRITAFALLRRLQEDDASVAKLGGDP